MPRRPRAPLPPRDPSYVPADNHYWLYHGLDELLACKRPVTASQDEDLFITVHQVSELCFHQMILDLHRSIDAMRDALATGDPVGDTAEACYFLARVVKLYAVVNQAVPTLTALRGFSEFRAALGPSSGFQSVQFRKVEILTGVGRAYWKGGTADAAGTIHPAETAAEARYGAEIAAMLEARREHNLVHHYKSLTTRAPVATLRAHPHASRLLRQLGDLDRAQLRFHRSHLRMAAAQLAMVGVTVGTGGTTFRTYLQRYERELAPLFPGLGAA